jgi:hypothetical protein
MTLSFKLLMDVSSCLLLLQLRCPSAAAVAYFHCCVFLLVQTPLFCCRHLCPPPSLRTAAYDDVRLST